MSDTDFKHESRTGAKRDDGIPVLTDIVGPEITDESSPYVVMNEQAETDVKPAATDDDAALGHGAPDIDDRREASSPTEATGPETSPDDRSMPDLTNLSVRLTAELNHAAARIVDQSVEDVEDVLREHVTERLKHETRAIVDAVLTDYERRNDG